MKEQKAPTNEKPITGARWLGQHMIHEVPARDLTRDEYIQHRQKILESENALKQAVYAVTYEGDS